MIAKVYALTAQHRDLKRAKPEAGLRARAFLWQPLTVSGKPGLSERRSILW